MARDYTKYTVSGLGKNLNKRQLVFQIVKDYIEKKKPSFDELKAVFKDEIQGSRGFIKKAAKVEDPKRYNTKMPLKIKYGVEVVVSNQWGSKNIDGFLSLAKKLRYKITFVEQLSSASDDLKPSSNLTTEQIAEFKEQEAEINGDYNENAWEASSLYDDLIEAGDTAWADSVLQKMEDAAQDFANLETVFEKLKERNETVRFLAVVKKAEAMATDTSEFMLLAELVSDSDKNWAIELYKKAEEKVEDVRDYITLADEVKEIDKNWIIGLYQKAESVADDYNDIISLATEIKELDKDWSIKLYQKAETKAESSFELRDLGENVYLMDKDWAASLMSRAEEKAEEFNDFINLGDTYGNSDLFNEKAKAKTLFEKAFPLIETKWNKDNLLNSAKEILGDEDEFTKKMIQLIEDSIPKMKLPKQYFPDYKLEWGKYITFTLANGPACHKIDYFNIKLDMETNEVIGQPDCDDVLSRWFDSWEVAIYDSYAEARSYNGQVQISGENGGEGSEWWHISGYDYGFEELEDGELPNGVTGDDIWNALGDGKAIYELYYHIKTFGE